MLSVVRDAETLRVTHYTSWGDPFCPLCDKQMALASGRRGETVWRCSNAGGNGDDVVACPLIEGRLKRRGSLLWGCKYEARPINAA